MRANLGNDRRAMAKRKYAMRHENNFRRGIGLAFAALLVTALAAAEAKVFAANDAGPDTGGNTHEQAMTKRSCSAVFRSTGKFVPTATRSNWSLSAIWPIPAVLTSRRRK